MKKKENKTTKEINMGQELKQYNNIHNKNLELDVLATLAFSDMQHKIALLAEDDFYSLDTREIYKQFFKSYKDSGVIDVSLLQQEINYTLIVNRNTTVLPSQLDIRIEELKDLSAKRKIKAISDRAGVLIREGKDSDTIRKWQIAQIEKIKTIKDIDLEAIDQRFEDILDRDGVIAVETGFRKFDRLTGGFLEGTLNIIAAAQGVGKTTLAVNMACNMAKAKKKVLFVTGEMTQQTLYAKIVSYLTGITYLRVLMGKDMVDNQWVHFNDADYSKITNARAEVADYDMTLYGERGLSTLDIKSKIAEVDGADIVFVDYLQRLRPTEKGSNTYEKISNIAKELKNIALQTNTPLVVISSINRKHSDETDFRPKLSDLRGSGEIEYEADMVLFLHRDSAFRKAKYDENEYEFEHAADLTIAKNRYGESNLRIELFSDGEKSLIKEVCYYDNEIKSRSDING